MFIQKYSTKAFLTQSMLNDKLIGPLNHVDDQKIILVYKKKMHLPLPFFCSICRHFNSLPGFGGSDWPISNAVSTILGFLQPQKFTPAGNPPFLIHLTQSQRTSSSWFCNPPEAQSSPNILPTFNGVASVLLAFEVNTRNRV